MYRKWAALTGAILISMATGTALAEFPGVRLKGTLTDTGGTPLEGLQTVTVLVYKTVTGGSPVYTESFTTMLTGGAFDVIVGAGLGTTGDDFVAAMAPVAAEPYERYLTMSIGAEEFAPRRKMTGTVFAAAAADAHRLGGQPVETFATKAELTTYAQLNPPGGQTFTGTTTYDSTSTVIFNQPGGTAPFQVTSTTLVQNLNAEYLGGVSITQLAQLGTVNTFTANQIFQGGASFTSTGAPFTVSSTTMVENLNAQYLGGVASSQFARVDAPNTFSGLQTFSGAHFGGTDAPFTVESTAQVTNLNAALLNGMTAAQIAGGGVSCTNCSFTDSSNVFTMNQSMPTASFTTTTGAPFTVSSTAQVDGLNAQYLNGMTAAQIAGGGVSCTNCAFTDSTNTFAQSQTFTGGASLSGASFTATTGAPFSVASTVQVDGLNAQYLNGMTAAQIAGGGVSCTNCAFTDSTNTFAQSQTFTGGASLSGASFTATTGAPFAVASSVTVAGLSADLLDGIDSNSFAQVGTTNTFTQSQTFSGGASFSAGATFSNASFTATQGAPPFSVTSNTEVPNLNAALLNGLTASQISGGAGTCTNCSFTDSANVFTMSQTMPSASFTTAVGAPFTISNTNPGTNLVGGLNAEYLNGMPLSAFSTTGHSHALPSNVAFTDSANTFTMNQTLPTASFTATTGAPFTIANTNPGSNLVGGLNAEYLNGMPLSAFSTTGHSHALPSNVAFTDSANTFTMAQTMPSAAFTVTTGAPFTVASGAVVTNLNADLLDGVHATQLARLADPNTFAAAQTFSAQAAFNVAGTAPFTVGNTNPASNRVDHLNAQYLNGIESSGFASASHTHGDGELSGNVMLLNNSQTATGFKTFNPSVQAAPFSVASKTGVVTNLNADMLDGLHASQLAHRSEANTFSNTQTFSQQAAFTVTGMAPFTVSSGVMVNNLNAAMLDGNAASAFATAVHTHTNISFTSLTGTLGTTQLGAGTYGAAISFTNIGTAVMTSATITSTANITTAVIEGASLTNLILSGTGTLSGATLSGGTFNSGVFEAGSFSGTHSGDGSGLTGITLGTLQRQSPDDGCVENPTRGQSPSCRLNRGAVESCPPDFASCSALTGACAALCLDAGFQDRTAILMRTFPVSAKGTLRLRILRPLLLCNVTGPTEVQLEVVARSPDAGGGSFVIASILATRSPSQGFEFANHRTIDELRGIDPASITDSNGETQIVVNAKWNMGDGVCLLSSSLTEDPNATQTMYVRTVEAQHLPQTVIEPSEAPPPP